MRPLTYMSVANRNTHALQLETFNTAIGQNKQRNKLLKALVAKANSTKTERMLG